MKPLTRALVLSLIAFAMALAGPAAIASDDIDDKIGLALWSLRVQLKEDVSAALELAKSYGIKEVETYVMEGVPAEKLAQELKAKDLRAVSAHVSYGLFERDFEQVVRDLKTLGVTFTNVPFPRVNKERVLTPELAREMAANFNKWGAALKKEGIRFGFHPHGLEFRPLGDGSEDTVFDLIVRETNPEHVCYQMDVFWVYITGQDPVKLLKKYPNRWVSLHVKDLRKDALTGVHTGSAPPTDNVAVGTGQIDWPAVLRAAQEVGVKHYFLEDETPAPLQCIPASLKYLRALEL